MISKSGPTIADHFSRKSFGDRCANEDDVDDDGTLVIKFIDGDVLLLLLLLLLELI